MPGKGMSSMAISGRETPKMTRLMSENASTAGDLVREGERRPISPYMGKSQHQGDRLSASRDRAVHPTRAVSRPPFPDSYPGRDRGRKSDTADET